MRERKQPNYAFFKMQTVTKLVLFISALTLFLGGCSKNSSFTNPNNLVIKVLPEPVPAACGLPFNTGLLVGTDSVGYVKVTNTTDTIYVSYMIHKAPWLLKSARLYAGNCDSIPKSGQSLDASKFPYSINFSALTNTYTFKIPLSKLGACFCISAQAVLTQIDSYGVEIMSYVVWAKGIKTPGETPSSYFPYCKQTCTNCEIKSGDFRTQTQGGWGSTPHGNNPGSYLHKNYAGAFPTGLVVGCASNYTVKFTNAQAITDFLPCGGPGKPLTKSDIDPACFKNVFASQLIALSLSLGFDAYDPNFSSSSIALGTLKIAAGPFKGWTINAVVAEANKVLGGCPSNYTAQQLNDVLSSINENFVDGTHSGGNVTCP